MHKIDHETATAEDEFTEGNPQTATPATRVTSKWLNTMQREVVAVVEGAGLTLDEEDDAQLLAAISSLPKMGVGAPNPAGVDGVYIKDGDYGGATYPLTHGLTIESAGAGGGGDARPGIVILSPANSCGHLHFGDPDDDMKSEIGYNHSIDKFEVLVDGAEIMQIDPAAINLLGGMELQMGGEAFIEVGSWTPTMFGSTTPGSPTYGTQVGRYVRIGSSVWVSCNIAITAKGGMAGKARIGGLPFEADSTAASRYAGPVSYHTAGLTYEAGRTTVGAIIWDNGGYMSLWNLQSGVAGYEQDVADVADSTQLYFSCWYIKQ